MCDSWGCGCCGGEPKHRGRSISSNGGRANRCDDPESWYPPLVFALFYLVLGIAAFGVSTIGSSNIPVLMLHWKPVNSSSSNNVMLDKDGSIIFSEFGNLVAVVVGNLVPLYLVGSNFLIYMVVYVLVFLAHFNELQNKRNSWINVVKGQGYFVIYILSVLLCASLAGQVTVGEIFGQVVLAVAASGFFYLAHHGGGLTALWMAFLFLTCNWAIILVLTFRSEIVNGYVAAVVLINLLYYATRNVWESAGLLRKLICGRKENEETTTRTLRTRQQTLSTIIDNEEEEDSYNRDPRRPTIQRTKSTRKLNSMSTATEDDAQSLTDCQVWTRIVLESVHFVCNVVVLVCVHLATS